MRPLCILVLAVVAFTSQTIAAEASTETSLNPVPFQISVPQPVLDRLYQKLALASFPEAYATDDKEPWEKGVSIAYMKELHTYWSNRTVYNWRERERELNSQLPQFTLDIEGHRVHFVHKRSSRPDAIPMLFSHGWPGSFLECKKVLQLLTEPSDPSQPAFHVVCPSLPGFGFSSKPTTPGMSPAAMANLFSKLMDRLSYRSGAGYVAQGGDWGSIIVTYLAQTDPQCKAIHFNMAIVAPPLWLSRYPQYYAFYRLVRTLFELALPDWFLSAEEAEMAKGPLKMAWSHTGYFHTQATTPDALGVALHDSPIGLASWLVEKYRRWSDCKGEVETRFSKQELLDLVMIYYVSETTTSAMRLYYEAANAHLFPLAVLPLGVEPDSEISTLVRLPFGFTWPWKQPAHKQNKMLEDMLWHDVKQPSAAAMFATEIARAPRAHLEPYYNLKQYSILNAGGHFAAMEEPKMLVEDFSKFIKEFVVQEFQGTVPANQEQKDEL